MLVELSCRFLSTLLGDAVDDETDRLGKQGSQLTKELFSCPVSPIASFRESGFSRAIASDE